MKKTQIKRQLEKDTRWFRGEDKREAYVVQKNT